MYLFVQEDEKETVRGHQEASVQERYPKFLKERGGASWGVSPGLDTPW